MCDTLHHFRFQSRLHRIRSGRGQVISWPHADTMTQHVGQDDRGRSASDASAKMTLQLTSALSGIRTLQWFGNVLWVAAVAAQTIRGVSSVSDPKQKRTLDANHYRFTIAENGFMMLQLLALLLMLWHAFIPSDAAFRAPYSRMGSPRTPSRTVSVSYGAIP